MSKFSIPIGKFEGPYGSTITVKATYDTDKKQACLEAGLSWLHFFEPLTGNVCEQPQPDGTVIVTGHAEIAAFGRKAATADVALRLQALGTNFAVIGYSAKVCGSNTFTLKCRTWQGGTSPPSVAGFTPLAAVEGAGGGTPLKPLISISLEQSRDQFPSDADYLSYQAQYSADAQNLTKRRTAIEEYLFELAEGTEE